MLLHNMPESLGQQALIVFNSIIELYLPSLGPFFELLDLRAIKGVVDGKDLFPLGSFSFVSIICNYSASCRYHTNKLCSNCCHIMGAP
jgi:hypothetical protein